MPELALTLPQNCLRIIPGVDQCRYLAPHTSFGDAVNWAGSSQGSMRQVNSNNWKKRKSHNPISTSYSWEREQESINLPLFSAIQAAFHLTVTCTEDLQQGPEDTDGTGSRGTSCTHQMRPGYRAAMQQPWPRLRSSASAAGSRGGFKAILLIPAHAFSPSANFLWRWR